MSKWLRRIYWPLTVLWLAGCMHNPPVNDDQHNIDHTMALRTRNELLEKLDSGSLERIRKGTEQLARNWRATDGTPESFRRFCLDNFLSGPELDSNFQRITKQLVLLWGNIDRVREKFTEPDQYTDMPALKADRFFRKSVPRVDMYKGKLALFIQLNFPYYTLNEKRTSASSWSREKWAMVRLGDIYAERKDRRDRAGNEEEVAAFNKYMENYFVRMDHVSMPDGSYPFLPGVSLHSHRGLRDDIKEQYTLPGGKARQELSGKVMEHIVKGTIPDEFLNDTSTRWNPWTNQLFRNENNTLKGVKSTPQGVKRYQGLLAVFHKHLAEDSAYGGSSTYVQRNFEQQNMLEGDVEQLIRNFLSDPVIDSTAKLIGKRLGRPLEPFDIWYSGFQEQAFYRADMLDSIVQKRYPDAAAFQNDLPVILHNMGFPLPDARYLGAHIRVRPVTSGGYTKRPPFRNDTSIMTTMLGAAGMDYKSYRVAIHELGHAVEMLYTANGVDNFILADVPSNGITEGVAELLAYKNMEGLHLPGIDVQEQKHIQALATLWYLVEMGGQALTDIETWKWLYAHPSATAADLKAAVLDISGGIWNRYYAHLFGLRDQHILSIYNHFICGELYLYNYFVSNVVMFQLYSAFGQDLSAGLKHACKEGNTLPDLWMQHAVHAPISLQPLLHASENALEYFNLNDH